MSELGAHLDIATTPTGWRLAGEIDAHTAPALAEAMQALGAGETVVDLADVTFLDSSGLRVLIAASGHARDLGGDLVLAHPTAAIHRLLEISGLHEHLTVRG